MGDSTQGLLTRLPLTECTAALIRAHFLRHRVLPPSAVVTLWRTCLDAPVSYISHNAGMTATACLAPSGCRRSHRRILAPRLRARGTAASNALWQLNQCHTAVAAARACAIYSISVSWDITCNSCGLHRLRIPPSPCRLLLIKRLYSMPTPPGSLPCRSCPPHQPPSRPVNPLIIIHKYQWLLSLSPCMCSACGQVRV